MAYIRHMTLTANTVQAFTVTGTSANASAFEILNRNGAGEIYISHDGTATPADPASPYNDNDVVPAAVGAAVQLRRASSSQNPITVKVISPAATAVSFRTIA